MTICKTLWQHFTRTLDRAAGAEKTFIYVQCMAIKVCASNPEKEVWKCECLLSHPGACITGGRTKEKMGRRRPWQGPRQTYLANAETEIFAPRRDNRNRSSQKKWKTLSGPSTTDNWQSTPLFPILWPFHPLGPGPGYPVYLPVLFRIRIPPLFTSQLFPVLSFIFSKCIFVVQFQTASAILFRPSTTRSSSKPHSKFNFSSFFRSFPRLAMR